MKKLTLRNQAFIELLASYKNWLDVLGYAESTVYNLPNHLREFFHFLERHGHSDISRITTKLIQDYYKELAGRTNQRRGGGLSKAFLNKHQQALKKFLTYLKEHNANIKFGVHLRGEKIEYHTTDKVILTQDEMIVHINTEDILFEKQRIYVRKGKNYKERFVPINTYNLQLLEDYLYEGRPEFLNNYQTDALLLSQFGKRINDMSIANRLKAIIEATEDETIQSKHITLHTLRHSIATHLLQNNVPMKSISQFLGHSSMESTQIYTHLVKSINQ